MKYLFYLFGTIFISLLSINTFADDSADDNTGRDDKQSYHLFEGVDLISTLKLQYDKPRIVIKAIYPQINSYRYDEDEDEIDGFNPTVMDLINQTIASYKTRVKSNQNLQRTLTRSAVKNDLYIDFATSFIRSAANRIISVRFTIQEFITGSGRPYSYHMVLNYNLADHRVLDLSDLFLPDANYLEVISQYINNSIAKRTRSQSINMSGTAPLPENFKNWNIKSNGLLFTLDRYQLAPYLSGSQTILVPYSALTEILNPDSPIANCIKNKRRCSNNNILTGGFIDEAAINTSHRIFNPFLRKV